MPKARFIDRDISTVLFDLDGTLADTAPDLANALNYTLKLQGYPPLNLQHIRPAVTYGGLALIKLGFPEQPAHTSYEELRLTLLDYYKNNLHVDTQLFDGMQHVLECLKSQQIKWGIVTNKPSWLTDPLVKAMQLDHQAACIVSGDSTSESKPHAKPMLYACELAHCQASETVFIGDAITDIQAGKNAGMATMTALYGYINSTDKPHSWGADIMLNQPSDILNALNV